MKNPHYGYFDISDTINSKVNEPKRVIGSEIKITWIGEKNRHDKCLGYDYSHSDNIPYPYNFIKE